MEHIDPAEPVLGIRAWEARSDGRLCSVFFPAKWTPGINRAYCEPEGSLRLDEHEVPESGCVCGLHAFAELNGRDLAFYERPNIVIGTIAAWGRIEPIPGGFRAEFAKLVAIGKTPKGDITEQRAATRYGVPLVPMAELATCSIQHARPARFERSMSRAAILVVDCGPAARPHFDELRDGLHWLIDRTEGITLDMVVCGAGAFVVPLDGEPADRRQQLHAAVDLLAADTEGPALARGLERARGRVLWAHRRWSIDVVLIAFWRHGRETAEELRSCRRDGVRVLSLSPGDDDAWDGAGSVREALWNVPAKLAIRDDQWPADRTRREVAYPPELSLDGVSGAL